MNRWSTRGPVRSGVARIASRWALALAVGVASCAGCAEQQVTPRPPDLMLVVLDTVRADRVSSYGYDRPTTPQFDAVAAAGVLFEDATVPGSWTWPSHASIFTGEPPWVHGAHLATTGESETRAFELNVTRMRSDLPTLAERFAAAGYRTVCVAANEWLTAELGLTRGFETVFVSDNDLDVTEAASKHIAAADPRPLFLFVNLMAAHSPYRDGPGPWAIPDPRWTEPATAADWLRPYLTEELPRGVNLSRRADASNESGVLRYYAGELKIPEDGFVLLNHLYDAGVRQADFSLGRILVDWVARSPEGIVAVTSDHGDALGEHGLLDHRGAVYSEIVRVPLAIAAPGQLPPGKRVTEPVSLLELSSTLLRLAGLDAPSQGLLPAVAGHGAGEPVLAMAWPVESWGRRVGGRFADRWALYRDGDWALVSNGDDVHELYDLRHDPGMTRDRAAEQPERVADFRRRARDSFSMANEASGTEVIEPSEETLERLRQLGYGD